MVFDSKIDIFNIFPLIPIHSLRVVSSIAFDEKLSTEITPDIIAQLDFSEPSASIRNPGRANFIASSGLKLFAFPVIIFDFLS